MPERPRESTTQFRGSNSAGQINGNDPSSPLSGLETRMIAKAIGKSFVVGYRSLLSIAFALSVASSLRAAFFVDSERASAP